MLYTPAEDEIGMRLDALVARAADISRSAAVKLIEAGDVTVGGARADKKRTAKRGD